MRDQVVILAGGLGTRMWPRTEKLPKFLLPVAGRPFAEWLLEKLVASGFDEALVCIGHMGDRVREALGDGARFGISLRYAEEGPKLLGTAGALRNALDLLEPSFVVTYGDSYLPFDYRAPLLDLRAHPEAQGTMAVYENKGRFDRSNTIIEGELVRRYEKQAKDAPPDPAFTHIDYGAMALRREVIEALVLGSVKGLDEIQRDLARSGELRAFEVKTRFYEIGSEAGLQDLEAKLNAMTHDR